MSPAEVKEALDAIKAEIGKDCDLAAHISVNGYSHKGEPLFISCRPYGYGNDRPSISVNAHTWEEGFAALRVRWEEVRADCEGEKIKRMALAIIRITAETGGCSDAALRADRFNDDDIEQFGEAAVNMADDMASNGPFAITKIAASNAA